MLDPGAEVTSREAENIFTVVSSVADEVGRLGGFAGHLGGSARDGERGGGEGDR